MKEPRKERTECKPTEHNFCAVQVSSANYNWTTYQTGTGGAFTNTVPAIGNAYRLFCTKCGKTRDL